MTETRSGWARPVALFAVASLLYLFRAAILDRLDATVAWAGRENLELLFHAAYALAAGMFLWQLRHVPGRVGGAVVSALESLEKRLFGWLPERLVPRAVGLVTGLAVAGVVLVAEPRLELFERLENLWIDDCFSRAFPETEQVDTVYGSARRSRSREQIDDDILIVEMNNETLNEFGWPMARHLHAQLIDAISAGRPKSITYDVLFVDPSKQRPEWDREIGQAAARAGNVIFGFVIEPGAASGDADGTGRETLAADRMQALPEYGDDVRANFVIDDIATLAAGWGFVNMPPNLTDGILRRPPLVARVGDRVYPSLALRAALLARDVPLSAVDMSIDDRGFGALSGGAEVAAPVDEFARSRVRFVGRYSSKNTFRYLQFHKIIRRVSFSLPGNPAGPDLVLEVDRATVLRLDGEPTTLLELDLERARTALSASGILTIDEESGLIVSELDLLTAAPKTPVYEMAGDALRFHDQLNGLHVGGVPSAMFANKHVLVGSTAQGAHDELVTPVGAMPGVEIHATILNNLLKNGFIRRAPEWIGPALVVLVGLLLGLIMPVVRPSTSIPVAFVIGFALLFGLSSAFGQGVHVPAAPVVATLLGTFLLVTAHRLRAEQRERLAAEESRSFVERTFGRYLSDSVVTALLDSPDGLKLGGERRRVTILMSDLRGFTSLSARLEPEAVVDILNNYLGIMTEIIVRWDGTIDEFIGDAILVAFGAPVHRDDDEARAVACALEMQKAMQQVDAWNEEHGYPKVEMGIGINTGDLVVGNIGSERRAKYAFVGTAINMCARIESYTVGGQLIVSESTRDAVGDILRVDEEMRVTPKGLKEPISIFVIGAIGGKYNVALDLVREELVKLLDPISVRYRSVEGKDVSGILTVGMIRALSTKGAHLELQSTPADMTNLSLHLVNDDGTPVEGDVYGKVMAGQSQDGLSYLRFTSVPERPQRLFEKRRTASQPESALASEG